MAHVRDLNETPKLSLVLCGPALGLVAIWGVRQRMENQSLLSTTFKYINKYIKKTYHAVKQLGSLGDSMRMNPALGTQWTRLLLQGLPRNTQLCSLLSCAGTSGHFSPQAYSSGSCPSKDLGTLSPGPALSPHPTPPPAQVCPTWQSPDP